MIRQFSLDVLSLVLSFNQLLAHKLFLDLVFVRGLRVVLLLLDLLRLQGKCVCIGPLGLEIVVPIAVQNHI